MICSREFTTRTICAERRFSWRRGERSLAREIGTGLVMQSAALFAEPNPILVRRRRTSLHTWPAWQLVLAWWVRVSRKLTERPIAAGSAER